MPKPALLFILHAKDPIPEEQQSNMWSGENSPIHVQFLNLSCDESKYLEENWPVWEKRSLIK